MHQDRSKYRVLIVEDDNQDAAFLTLAFHRCGDFFECEHINNGTQAFDRLIGCKTGVTDDRPDLIVLDLDLPGMRGEQLMALCQLSSAMEHVPVVVFSGSIDHEMDLSGQFSDGVHALAKPDDWTGYTDAAISLLRIAASRAGAPRLNS
jgi:CheY-like chemotaxis protein